MLRKIFYKPCMNNTTMFSTPQQSNSSMLFNLSKSVNMKRNYLVNYVKLSKNDECQPSILKLCRTKTI